MGIELSRIGVRTRKFVVSTIRGCFVSLSAHPFLLGNLCILIFLYRSSPSVFSVLISASPVVICTAILLGALLSSGQRNPPENENETQVKDNKTTIEPLPVRDSKEAILVDQPSISSTSRDDEIHSLNDDTESRKTEDIWEDTTDEFRRNEESEESHYPLILKSDSEKSLSNSFDSDTATVNSPNSPQSPDVEDVISNSSDDGESSSPDASMTDIMPIIDELHPLLDEDSSNPIHISRVGSEVASEQSLQSITSRSSSDSADDMTENCGESEVEDEDGNEDDEGENEEKLKSGIIWTEEDQRNLMDLGSSEIERNQRLENLLRRRGMRKNLSMLPEINLIDLGGSDILPPQISTSRKNPFDDSYDNSNIPGSAPCVMLNRQNPFEIPYVPGPGQEMFQEGLTLTSTSTSTNFSKRHPTFTMDSSVFAPNMKMRPYFVPERAITEEPGFPQFDCQSSGPSDSKSNSAPDTESVCSAEDHEEDQKSPEEDVISRQEEVMEEDQETINIKKEFSEEDATQEPQLISEMNDVAEHIGHGSHSSSEYEEESSENIAHENPVYDSSPPTHRKNLSSSSCGSFEMHVESHTSLPPVLVKRMVSFAERDSENRIIEKEVIAGDTEENSDGDDYHEAKERLLTTPPCGVGTPMFYDMALRALRIENNAEEPVPNTPVESSGIVRTIHNLNIPKIYELDRDSTSPSQRSPLCPDFISMRSRARPHMDVETIEEEADDIKEIDEGLSSDLDSVGDLEKHVIDSAGETSLTGDVIEVNSMIDSAGETSHSGDAIEVKGTEHQTILENQRDEIDMSNHSSRNDISGRNDEDTQSVENVDHLGPAHQESIVNDESLVEESPLNCDRVNSAETSELDVGETIPLGSSLQPVKEFQKSTDNGSVEVEVKVKVHEDLGSSSSAKERDLTSESSSSSESDRE